MQKTIVTSIRLPAQVRRQGKIEAAKNDTTLSRLVCDLLENYLNELSVKNEVKQNEQRQPA